MRIDCPGCLRVLEYSGERPSFCGYCGVPLFSASAVRFDASTQPEATTDTNLERTAAAPSSLAETVDYQSEKRRTAQDDQFPDRIAGYRLIRKLGSGGMGTVFEAEDEAQAQRVAIKVISGDYVSSHEAVERFRQEGRLASAVTHPRCVFVLAVDEFLGHPYIVMELMPGTTLQTLVEKDGPLDASSAIVKILDIIDGLREFHKIGLIHRDVKPSNCFLEDAGRVKIGDFGLSKSLDSGMDLTRSGTFIGTPLYASPEQIKHDVVDERTDVYSVAATLYYLLTGRPPVQAKDAAEALARIASEPAPPLRGYRPDLPRALEAAIHRGLERDPARRWRNLQEFHDALLPFLVDRLSIAGIGLRAAAYACDLGLAYLLSWAIFGLVLLYHRSRAMQSLQFLEHFGLFVIWFERFVWVAYFALLEGAFGASLGKWLAGLRVSRVDRGGPPGLGRGLVRTIVFFAITELPADLVEMLAGPIRGPRRLIRFWAYDGLIRGLGLLSLLLTMSKASGFRGPHEWASGTRVIQLRGRGSPRLSRRLHSLVDSRLASSELTPTPRHNKIGPYVIRGVVRSEHEHTILLAQDPTLERPVWIILRGRQSAPLPPARRALNRRARPRWIGGGDEPDGRWDAFTAPAGVPLTELVRAEALPWRDVLPMLRDLAEELQIAMDEGSLPRRLSLDQVWVQADGEVQLADSLEEPRQVAPAPPAAEAGPSAAESRAVPPIPATGTSTSSSQSRIRSQLASFTRHPDEVRALAFLREVARLSLEGDRRRPREAPSPDVEPARHPTRPIRAAVPQRARSILMRLAGVRAPFSSLSSLRAELEAAAAMPLETSPLRRGIHLAIQAFFLLPGLFLMFLLSFPPIRPRAFPWDLETLIAVPFFWMLWAILTRGGLSLTLAGLTLVQRDGRQASLMACCVRAFLVWAPLTLLLVGSRFLEETTSSAGWLSWGLWIGGVVLVIAYAAVAILFPSRAPHDRLAGTVLVPI
jgi:eukaryotic-like serine/threonine-protein kinase